jgi:hypothetical protein
MFAWDVPASFWSVLGNAPSLPTARFNNSV